jgi:PHD/YefM family antitoxin component YafN of YafNO toxin-antitoxin module
MNKNLAIKKISLSRLNRNFDAVFNSLISEPVALTKNGRITAYLISASAYESLIQNAGVSNQIEGLFNIRAT